LTYVVHILTFGLFESKDHAKERVTMKVFALAIIAAGMFACGGEKPDELGPYVQKLAELDGKYVDKIVEYQGYLSTPGMDQKAADIQQVMKGLHDELAAYPEIENKKISAMNNKLKRTIGDADNAGARRKLVEPDVPTFVPNAQSAIKMVIEELTVVHNNMEKLWVDEGKTEPFPLKWNQLVIE
jgi:hypothetical protein